MNPYAPSPHDRTEQPPPIRRRLRVTGIVQGVGFRPHVYSLALRLGLAGFVGNDSAGVLIEIEGPAATLDRFETELLASPPPMAAIERIESAPLAAQGEERFTIAPSLQLRSQRTFVPPDLALCADCRRELFDPDDRRHLYPFINCTNCGPRFTIIRDTPYDRPATTMAPFVMCAACRSEYSDPANRRFHAQPIACPACGPQLTWRPSANGMAAAGEGVVPSSSAQARTLAALRSARQMLAAGGIVAVKGLGGFHLACNAADDRAVALLRQRKGRAAKPFAVMAADLATARRYALIDDDEAALLGGRARPIVLLRRRPDASLAQQVAPGQSHLGLMLPYTPLHELLFHLPGDSPQGAVDLPLLVMTSGNLSEEPIAWRDEDALERLAPLVDGFLLHDRPIHVPCDDSVLRVFGGCELPIRRARGYAPAPLLLAGWDAPPLLAAGADLKAAFCLAQGEHAVLSQHIGDMGNLATYMAFGAAVEHLQRLLRIEPEILACDLHPGYLSTRWAQEHGAGRPIVRVQHHHAHIASLLAEHGLVGEQESIIGFSWDGTGYGDDGAIWGSEVLVANCAGYQRRAHLRYVPLPGGDAAVSRPYRTALAHLWAAGIPWEPHLPPVAACPPGERALLDRQLQTGAHCFPTSSMGRLFDAVASLLGVCQAATYEAEAAQELEALLPADWLPQPEDGGAEQGFALLQEGAVTICDPAPLLNSMVAGMAAGRPHAAMAAAFYTALVRLIVQVSLALRAETGLARVGLSGGVFQSRLLLAGAVGALRRQGFDVLLHRFAPPNDGGIALGQVAAAVARLRRD